MSHRTICIAFLSSLVCAGLGGVGLPVNGPGEKVYELHVTVPQANFHSSDEIMGTISIVNRSTQAVAVAKPQLPSAWSVRYFGMGSTEQPLASWEGSVLRGTTDPGHARRYQTDQYETIEPGHTFGKPIDLRWFIRNQRDTFPDGCYVLKFWYRYAAGQAEADLKLLQAELSCEELRVCVTRAD